MSTGTKSSAMSVVVNGVCVDEKTIYLVHGYVHSVKNMNKLNKIIPSAIIQLLITFYFISEHFDKCGKNASISTNKLTITTSVPKSHNSKK